MPDDDTLTAVAALVDDEPALEADRTAPLPWMRRLGRAVARHLPVDGAGVSLIVDESARGVAAASDEVSLRLEELQFVLGEGPCLDAFSARRPVLEPDLAGSASWPAYVQLALDLGVQAVFAFPLQIGRTRLGVLDVYRSVPGPLPDAVVQQASSFAELAAHNLIDAHLMAADGWVDRELEAVIEHQAEVYKAQGMVMVDLDVSFEEAMARLRAHAFVTGRRLRDVAEDVVAGALALDADAPRQGWS